MYFHFLLFLQSTIEKKLANVPQDSQTSYKLGLFIGSLLPFVILVGIAYYLYYRFKNRKDLE